MVVEPAKAATANSGAGASASPSATAVSKKTIIHAPSGDNYSITLADGTGVQLPVVTEDKDLIEKLQEFVDHHRGLLVCESLDTYEANAEKAAKAAAAAE